MKEQRRSHEGNFGSGTSSKSKDINQSSTGTKKGSLAMSRRNNAARKYQPQQSAALLNALATLQISPVMLEVLQLLQQDPSTVERLKEFLSQPQNQQQKEKEKEKKTTPVQGSGRAGHISSSASASSLTHLQPKSLEPKLQFVSDDRVLEQDYQPPLTGMGGPIALPAGGDTASKKPDREKKAIGFDYNESVYLAEAKRLIALKVPEHVWNNPDLIPAQMRGAITRVLTILLAWANFRLFKAVFSGEVMTLPLEVFRAEAGMQASRLRVSGDKKNKKGQAESAFYIMQYVGLIETVQSVPEGSYRPGDITLPGYILPVDFHRLKELAYELPKKRGGAIFTSRTFQEAKTNFYRLKSDVAALLSRELPEFNPWIESDVRAIRDIESQTLVRRYEVKEALTSDSSDLSQTLVRQQSNVLAQKGLTEQKVREESDVAAKKRLTQPRSLKKNHEEEKEEDSHGSRANAKRKPPIISHNPAKGGFFAARNLALLNQNPEYKDVYDALIEFVQGLTGTEPSWAFVEGASRRALSGRYNLDYLAEIFSSMRQGWLAGKFDNEALEGITLWRIDRGGGDLVALRRVQERHNPVAREQRRAEAVAIKTTTQESTTKVLPASSKPLKRVLRQPVRDVVKSALKYASAKPFAQESIVIAPAELTATPAVAPVIGKLSQQIVQDGWSGVVARLADQLPSEVLVGSFPECDSDTGSVIVFLQKKHAGSYLGAGSAWRVKPIQDAIKASFYGVNEVLIREIY